MGRVSFAGGHSGWRGEVTSSRLKSASFPRGERLGQASVHPLGSYALTPALHTRRRNQIFGSQRVLQVRDVTGEEGRLLVQAGSIERGAQLSLHDTRREAGGPRPPAGLRRGLQGAEGDGGQGLRRGDGGDGARLDVLGCRSQLGESCGERVEDRPGVREVPRVVHVRGSSGLTQPVFPTDVKEAAMRDTLTLCVRSVLATVASEGEFAARISVGHDFE